MPETVRALHLEREWNRVDVEREKVPTENDAIYFGDVVSSRLEQHAGPGQSLRCDDGGQIAASRKPSLLDDRLGKNARNRRLSY
jgi:hypothetical protein